MDERDEMIRKMRDEGKTLAAIGDIFNLTRERVRQIVAAARSAAEQ